MWEEKPMPSGTSIFHELDEQGGINKQAELLIPEPRKYCIRQPVLSNTGWQIHVGM